MGCFSCFKPSSSVDPFEAETDIVLAVSRHEADIQEAANLASAIQESTRLLKQEEEEKRRRTKVLEEDAQIANAFLYEERECKINNKSALPDGEDELVANTHVEKSLKEKGKGKQLEDVEMKKDNQVKEDEKLAVIVQESINTVEDEQLEKVIWESLKGKGQIKQPIDAVEDDGNLPLVYPSRSMCGGCNSEIEHGRSVDVFGVFWHPECLLCDACDKPIAIHELPNHVLTSRGRFHQSCYVRYCYVCKEKKMKAYNQHHFWEERYCPAHEEDGTHKCCSCERLEPRGTNYVMLGDGRWLCLECMESAVMDTYEVQPLHFEIREYFEGLNMKIEKEFPFLLVEKQALNKAEEEEKIDYQYEVVTRGICLSEAQTITSVSKRPMMGPNKELMGMATESQRVVRECEVTAILILYGFPRLLTGYILAHEMMHAYLRLSGHRILNKVLEEGICQVLGHMWLESQTYASIDAIDAAASSSASSSSSCNPVASAPKKGARSDFEKKLVEFCKNQIETDDSPVYGVGFRKVNEMVTKSSLQKTLKEIIRWD